MKSRRHVALLVEDDPEMAAEMADLLDSLGYDSVHAATQDDAERLVEEGKFCFVLLDLEILARKGLLKARVECGFSVLRTIRERFVGVNERGRHAMQVIVVSGHGKDHRYTREAMRHRADDFICKPVGDARPSLQETITGVLEASGRTNHAHCDAITRTATAPVASGRVSITITGREVKRLIQISVNDRDAAIPPSSFIVLLQLVRGRLAGDEGWVHKKNLGARPDQGWRTMSRFKQDLARYLPLEHPVMNNDGEGRYQLHPSIEISDIDVEQLESSTNKAIRDLAAEIRKLRAT